MKCKRWGTVVVVSLAALGADMGDSAYAQNDEPAEPIFTQKAFLASEFESAAEWDQRKGADELTLGLGYARVFKDKDKWQLGIEVPVVFRNPDVGPSTSGVSDMELSVSLILPLPDRDTNTKCKESGFCLSVSGEVALPTGVDRKDIGGNGEWGAFIRAGWYGEILGKHLQLGYEQQIEPTDAQKEEADELGVGRTREKALVWNLALTHEFPKGFAKGFGLNLEVLGTTVLDAIERDEEGTIVELGVGGSFGASEHWKLRAGVKFPLTSRRESTGTALIILSWGIDSNSNK